VGNGALYTHPVLDVDLAGSPLPIRFERRYTSLDGWLDGAAFPNASRLATGWFHIFDTRLFGSNAIAAPTVTSATTAISLVQRLRVGRRVHAALSRRSSRGLCGAERELAHPRSLRRSGAELRERDGGSRRVVHVADGRARGLRRRQRVPTCDLPTVARGRERARSPSLGGHRGELSMRQRGRDGVDFADVRPSARGSHHASRRHADHVRVRRAGSARGGL
jgi:hypothetical protein